MARHGMNRRPRLPDLLAFVRLYLDVLAAIERGAAQPLTADATMNAYDFRPAYRGSLGPSRRSVLKAFKAMGFDTLATTDKGLNYANCLRYTHDYLYYYVQNKVAITDVPHIVCAFKHYCDLKEGRVTRWKLLR